MREKKRYFLLCASGVKDIKETSDILYRLMNGMDKTLAIRSNLRVIKDLYRNEDNCILTVISVINKYKYDVVFTLSLSGRFFPTVNIVTLKNSGSLKKLKGELAKYGTISK